MSQILKEIQQQHPFPTIQEEALVSLVRTVAVLSQPMDDLLQKEKLTHTQYNVLRILRGAGENGWSCKEIGERMVQREPDITRLLDRLENRGLISRKRDPADRRAVISRITRRGLSMLESLQPDLSRMAVKQFGSIQDNELERLLTILDAIRSANAEAVAENKDGR